MRATTTRRGVLRGLGAGTVGVSALGGCLGRGGGTLDGISVAYVPIYPNLQHYVMDAEGFYDELPVDVTTERFSAGPNVVKAFASGDVDVALFGITPAAVLVDSGTDAAVLAANSRNGFRVVGTSAVADLYEREGAAAFDRFEAERGRNIRVGAPPDGSVPDVVLRYWLREDLAVGEMASVVDKSTIPPARAVQAIQSGDVDATIVQEPFATRIERSDGFRELAWSGNILPSHPVTVLFANRSVLDAQSVARSLVERHVAATEFTLDSPDAAAAHAASIIGSGVDESLARTAMESRASDFLSDPHAVTDGAATLTEFVASTGAIDDPVPTESLFEFGPYDAVQ